MKKEILHNIILDRCSECLGLWFDKNEIESFEQLIRQVSNENLVHEIIHEITSGKYEIDNKLIFQYFFLYYPINIHKRQLL